MSIQQIFFFAGIAAFVLAVVFAAIAGYVFVTKDIRSVMDDLSGRSRERNILGLRGGANVRPKGGARHSEAVQHNSSADGSDSVSGGIQANQVPQSSAAPIPVVNFDIDDGSDDIPTVVTSFDQYHSVSYAENEGGDIAADGDLATVVDAQAVASPSFKVTKRIVLVHSEGVITAG